MPRKTAAVSIKDDDILADILGELQGQTEEASTSSGPGTSTSGDKSSKVIAPAKIVSSSSRKTEAALAKEYMNNFMNNLKTKESSKKSADKGNSDDELLDGLLKTKVKEKTIVKPATPAVTTTLNSNSAKEDSDKEVTKAAAPTTEKLSIPDDDDMDFSCLQDDENQFDIEKTMSTNASKETEKEKSPVKPLVNKKSSTEVKKPTINLNQEEDIQNLLSNWENICQMDSFEEELTASTLNSAETVEGNAEDLRFWYWEAWEDPVRIPGVVFLFGRTEDGKSICVRVEKIDRVVYLLPREYVSIRAKL